MTNKAAADILLVFDISLVGQQFRPAKDIRDKRVATK